MSEVSKFESLASSFTSKGIVSVETSCPSQSGLFSFASSHTHAAIAKFFGFFVIDLAPIFEENRFPPLILRYVECGDEIEFLRFDPTGSFLAVCCRTKLLLYSHESLQSPDPQPLKSLPGVFSHIQWSPDPDSERGPEILAISRTSKFPRRQSSSEPSGSGMSGAEGGDYRRACVFNLDAGEWHEVSGSSATIACWSPAGDAIALAFHDGISVLAAQIDGTVEREELFTTSYPSEIDQKSISHLSFLDETTLLAQGTKKSAFGYGYSDVFLIGLSPNGTNSTYLRLSVDSPGARLHSARHLDAWDAVLLAFDCPSAPFVLLIKNDETEWKQMCFPKPTKFSAFAQDSADHLLCDFNFFLIERPLSSQQTPNDSDHDNSTQTPRESDALYPDIFIISLTRNSGQSQPTTSLHPLLSLSLLSIHHSEVALFTNEFQQTNVSISLDDFQDSIDSKFGEHVGETDFISPTVTPRGGGLARRTSVPFLVIPPHNEQQQPPLQRRLSHCPSSRSASPILRPSSINSPRAVQNNSPVIPKPSPLSPSSNGHHSLHLSLPQKDSKISEKGCSEARVGESKPFDGLHRGTPSAKEGSVSVLQSTPRDKSENKEKHVLSKRIEALEFELAQTKSSLKSESTKRQSAEQEKNRWETYAKALQSELAKSKERSQRALSEKETRIKSLQEEVQNEQSKVRVLEELNKKRLVKDSDEKCECGIVHDDTVLSDQENEQPLGSNSQMFSPSGLAGTPKARGGCSLFGTWFN